MRTVTKVYEFDAAHRLKYHDGKCKNIHGHRYKVELTFKGEPHKSEKGTTNDGILIDFSNIKAYAEKVIDPLDHSYMLSMDDEKMVPFFDRFRCMKVNKFDFQTTAENLSKWIFEKMADEILKDYRGKEYCPQLVRVKLYETPTCWAVYQDNCDMEEFRLKYSII